MTPRLILDLGFAGAILLIIAAAVGYFYYTQNKITTLNTQVAQAEIKVKATQAVNDDLKSKMEQNKALIEQHDQQIDEIRVQTDALKNSLAKHDLPKLSAAKPKLVEKTINKSTDKMFKELETLTK